MQSLPQRRQSDTRPVPFPVLIADIGGTNVRLAILPEAHSPVRHFPTVQTGEFPDFVSAVSATVLDATALVPQSLLIALAAPVDALRMKLTNADWVLEPQQMKTDLGLSTVVTFNDFEALAMSLPALGEGQLRPLGGGHASIREPRIVLGPGTGLGVGALIYAHKRYMPLAGEGGHVNFGPESERDFAIWPHLERVEGRISAEALLSGNGLARLYRAIATVEGADPSWCKSGPDVTGAADKGDPIAEEALDLFLTYLGRVAGDLALFLLAKGGVYIGGGIAPRLAERFASSGFRRAFEAKAPHGAIMEAIPTYLITEPKPAVAGLSTFAQMPERFVMDLTGRRFDD